MQLHTLLLRPRLSHRLGVAGVAILMIAAIACGSSGDSLVSAPQQEDGVAQSDGEIATPTALPVVPPPDEVPAGLDKLLCPGRKD